MILNFPYFSDLIYQLHESTFLSMVNQLDIVHSCNWKKAENLGRFETWCEEITVLNLPY